MANYENACSHTCDGNVKKKNKEYRTQVLKVIFTFKGLRIKIYSQKTDVRE